MVINVKAYATTLESIANKLSAAKSQRLLDINCMWLAMTDAEEELRDIVNDFREAKG